MMMKTIRVIRITLSVAVLLVTAALVWLGHNETLLYYQLTLNLSSMVLGVLITWLIVTLLVGRVYCSSVCPIGTLQDFAAWLNKRLRHGGKGHYHFVFANDRIRYLTLLLVAVSLTADQRYTGYISSLLDPSQLFSYCLSIHGVFTASLFGLLGVGIALIILLGILWIAYRGEGRTFCNTICPVGTVLGFVSRASFYHFDIDTDLCTGCNQCVQECKAQCINPNDHTIDLSRCVMCMNCAASCPNRAIKFTNTRKRLSTPLMQPMP